jgi:membrane fusion protein
MSELLFRPAASAAKTSQWAGAIVLARPVPMRVAGWVAAVITLALALLLTFGEYTRKARVSGQVVPAAGAIKVVASAFGRMTKSLVEDGASVAAGDPMFDITAERDGSGGGADVRIGALLAARRDELQQTHQLQTAELTQRGQALAIRQRTIEAEIASRQQEVALQDVLIRAARDKLKRHAALASQGYFSTAQLSQVANELTAQQARRKALDSSILAVQRDLLQVREEAQAIGGKIKLTDSQAGQSLAALGQESAEHDGRSRIRVVAPVAGIVTALTLGPGQPVSAGATLATIIPAGSTLEAHLMVPSRAVGFIEPGQAVLLRLSAFAYQKFGQVAGTVMRVDRSPINETAAGAEPMYRVIVKLARQSVTAYGRSQQFKSGMTLEADILQDRRRLIEWVLDPIISAAKNRAR